jgi:methionyl-tRNA formyltransferase
MGVDAMIEGLEMVKAGVLLKHDQRLADGSYESWFKKDLAQIDWSKPTAEVYNTIRAANPAPGAWGMIKGIKLDIYDSARGSASGKAGSILAIDQQGMSVATGDGAILVKRVRAPGGQKIAAAEWAASAGVKAGDAFDAKAA